MKASDIEPTIFPLQKVKAGLINAGRGVEIGPGETEQVLRVSGDSSGATHMSITLVADKNQGDGVGDNPRPAGLVTAIVKWGNDGYQCETEVDVKNGTVITVPAGFVEVSMRNDEPVSLEIDNTVTCGAFIAYLPYFKPNNATKTVNAGALLANTVGPSILIPPFTIHVYAFFAPDVGLVDVEFLDRTGGIVLDVTGAANARAGIPNCNFTRFVRFVTGANAITASSFVFELSL